MDAHFEAWRYREALHAHSGSAKGAPRDRFGQRWLDKGWSFHFGRLRRRGLRRDDDHGRSGGRAGHDSHEICCCWFQSAKEWNWKTNDLRVRKGGHCKGVHKNIPACETNCSGVLLEVGVWTVWRAFWRSLHYSQTHVEVPSEQIWWAKDWRSTKF